MRPLYANHPDPGSKGNASLRFDKFFDGWDKKDRPIPDGEKLICVNGFTKGRVGDEVQLAEYAERIKALVDSLKGRPFQSTTQSRLVTGTGISHPVEVGFAWHHTLGVPYIPGSGVKGIVKEWAKGWLGLDVNDVLGIQEKVGSVVFLDAVPTKPVTLAADVMTPHYGDYYQDKSGKTPPGDWLSPTPIPFLTVAEGQEFLFAVVPSHARWAADCEKAMEWLKEALTELGAGAKTAAGYGRFVPAPDMD